ncbi:hypothetical protein [Flavobacterium crassostreae]|uniref:Dihydrolipoamide dehydrogenase n=1 Tax=Flavobacterium crassostreae TaxID=1763534 RepID=A0A1B9E8Y4_9FLAO|nr:hypothetical protein [Flavobacterium crassostreae]OCB78420.1 hypothetical protein LPBF_02525 [Flavobacterium crassostreae]
MKKIITLLSVIGLLVLSGCTGPQGPAGFDGLNGTNGLTSQAFEATVSFNGNNNYTKSLFFDSPLYSSDVVLVYHLYKVVNGTDVWRPVPQTYYLDNGDEVDYNFDFTTKAVTIFMGANFNLNLIPSGWTQNQTFRVVMVPAYFAASVNTNNYLAVMAALNKTDSEITKVEF